MSWLIPVAGGVLTATAATAQDYTPAPPQIVGEISASDQVDGRGRRYDEYPVEFVRGQRVVIVVAPAAGNRVAPGLEIVAYGAATPASSRLIVGQGRTVRLAFTAPQSGVFNIRIVSSSLAARRYSVSIRPIVGPATSIMRPPVTAPSQPGPGDQAPDGTDEPTGSDGPRSRFIICPGHPRCPRR